MWNHPVIDTDLSKIKLYEDSIRVSYDIVSEDPALRVFDIYYDWKKDKKYDLLVLDSAFTDIYSLRNDTVVVSFIGTDKKSLGELSLKITEEPKAQLIVELLSSNGSVVESRIVNELGIIMFERLNPGIYALRVIQDLNANNRWDSGWYSVKQQPEPIKTIQNEAEVRQNWELELEWNPNEN
ncbi:MAG: hypothetical protein ACPGD8_00130 [Flavobacteriales bacterium]